MESEEEENRPYRILQNGQKICYYLNQLANRYGYGVVLYHTDRRKQMLITSNLTNTSFPKVAASLVKDDSCFIGIKSNQPVIIKNDSYQGIVAGYSESSGKKVCALEALSKLLIIEDSERKNHIVVD